jgi:uncharacterized Zn finger protein (UPF0148 family)
MSGVVLMSVSAKDKMQLTVELIKRGAVMLKEPCSVCNGVQIRYRDKVYCTNHEDLAPALSASEVSVGDVLGSLRAITLVKLRHAALTLDKEEDLGKQAELISLILNYMTLLKEMPESQA